MEQVATLRSSLLRPLLAGCRRGQLPEQRWYGLDALVNVDHWAAIIQGCPQVLQHWRDQLFQQAAPLDPVQRSVAVHFQGLRWARGGSYLHPFLASEQASGPRPRLLSQPVTCRMAVALRHLHAPVPEAVRRVLQ